MNTSNASSPKRCVENKKQDSEIGVELAGMPPSGENWNIRFCSIQKPVFAKTNVRDASRYRRGTGSAWIGTLDTRNYLSTL